MTSQKARGKNNRPQTAGTLRVFDPVAVARRESDAWVAYYRGDWLAFARAAAALSRRTFGLSWPLTIYCSWLVLRATQMWAGCPDNDPVGAQRAIERFYRVVQRQSGEAFDPVAAAALEIEWWSVHRHTQRLATPGDDGALTDALARHYAHIYSAPYEAVLGAAEGRAQAMRTSDQWILEGCRLDSSLIPRERAALISAYAALLGAVGEPTRPDDNAAATGRPASPLFDNISTVT